MCASASLSLWETVEQHVKANEFVRGLAIVIGNQYSAHPTLKKLDGPLKDVQVMCQALKSLHYATLGVENASRQDILDVIQAVRDFFPRTSPLSPCYKRLVFVFAGHGDDTDSLHTRDGVVNLKAEVIAPLLPGSCQQLAHIPKLFFIDACRSELPALDDEQLKPRGGCQVPSTANYYLVNSTQLTQIALERSSGGYWMQMFARELCDPSNRGRVIQSVVIKVNKRLNETLKRMHLEGFLQQPIECGTLHEDVLFVDEATDFSHFLQTQPSVLQFPLATHPSLTGHSYGYSHSPFTPGAASTPVTIPMPQYTAPLSVASHSTRSDLYHSLSGSCLTPPQPRQTPTSPCQQLATVERGPNTHKSPSETGAAAKTISPITELEEYLTENCDQKPKIEYECKSVGGQYQATVIAPLIGYRKGKLLSTEEKARRSAAQVALNELRENN